jgi:hypothetical protein
MTAVATQEPQAEATQPRYAEGTEELSALILATREKIGRKALADWLGISQSATWRAEQGRIHPDEVDQLRERMTQVDQLPVPEPKARGLRAELTAVIDAAAADKKVTKAQLIAELRDALAPKA